MTDLSDHISIFKNCKTIVDINCILDDISKEESSKLVYLIDYIDWQHASWASIRNCSDYFAEQLIKKHENKLMTLIIFRDVSLKFIEKYMSSEYMNISLLIEYKGYLLTDEFASKHMNVNQLSYRSLVNGNRVKE